MIRVQKKDGELVVTLAMPEASLLRSLPRRLKKLLESPDFADRIVQRLFPPAYSDPEKDAEHRRLLGNDLRAHKMRAVAIFEATIQRWRVHGHRVDVTIRAEEFEYWLGFINDMRLVLGADLGIEDEGWGTNFDPSHPRAEDFALLHYLSWLEEEVLHAAG